MKYEDCCKLALLTLSSGGETLEFKRIAFQMVQRSPSLNQSHANATSSSFMSNQKSAFQIKIFLFIDYYS